MFLKTLNISDKVILKNSKQGGCKIRSKREKLPIMNHLTQPLNMLLYIVIFSIC